MGAFKSTNQKVIPLVISEINLGKNIRLSSFGAIREGLATKPNGFDPRKILGPDREGIKQTVQSKMKLLRRSEKAA